MRKPVVLSFFLLCAFICSAQDSSFADKLIDFPNRFFEKIAKKQEKMADRVQKQNEKLLKRLKAQEDKLYKRLKRVDSLQAMKFFAGVSAKYEKLENKISDPKELLKKKNGGSYVPRIDSLTTMLRFLEPLEGKKEQASKQLKKVGDLESAISSGSAIENLFDSSKGKEITAGASKEYQKLKSKLGNSEGLLQNGQLSKYIPGKDSSSSLFTSFQSPLSNVTKVLKQNPCSEALTKVNELKGRLAQADDIKKFISERQNALKGLTEKFTNLPKGMAEKYIGKYSKECYYYKAQLTEWKQSIKDPDKMEASALKLLNKLPAFKEFMKRNSELSKLFGNASNTTASLAGLQTRQAVMQQLQEKMGAGANPQQLIQQQVQSAQAELNKLKAKADELKNGNYGSGDPSMPDFKPNSQKTKPFLKRFEYSWNLQTGNQVASFPASNDLALSAGYKINDRFIIGIGAAYKFGLGEGWNKIKWSNDGIGIRSFIEWKISTPQKGIKVLFSNIWLTGGYEQNYWSKFENIPELKTIVWQTSGLIGLTKKIQYKKKQMNTQVLWDFLSYQQKTTQQAFKFRIGYSF